MTQSQPECIHCGGPWPSGEDEIRASVPGEVRKAFETKRAQLVTYRDGLADDSGAVSTHAATIAEGRLLQLDQDIALLSLIST